MILTPVSNAPEVFSAPLISAERPAIALKIFSAVTRALRWVRSLFTFVFPLKEKKVEPLPKQDIRLAQRALQIIDAAKPSPIRFIRTSIPQGIFPGVISWYQGTHSAFSAFVAKRAVDATSTGVVMIANAFFPSYSDAVKQGVALTLCAPAVFIAADELGYRQGYFFFLGIGINVCKLGYQVYSHYQTRAQRAQQRAGLTQANS